MTAHLPGPQIPQRPHRRRRPLLLP
jgi:hypothetical protein